MNAIGVLETNVVARGLLAADAMVKAADIKLVTAAPMCPGKYMVIVQGTVASVKSSLEAGNTIAGDALVGSILIPNLHPDIFPAISGTTQVETVDAVGMIETYSVPSAVMAADEAVKSAKITLIEVRLSRALGGKAFALFTGEVGAVRAAIDAGVKRVQDQGMVLSTAILPAPHKDLVKFLL